MCRYSASMHSIRTVPRNACLVRRASLMPRSTHSSDRTPRRPTTRPVRAAWVLLAVVIMTGWLSTLTVVWSASNHFESSTPPLCRVLSAVTSMDQSSWSPRRQPIRLSETSRYRQQLICEFMRCLVKDVVRKVSCGLKNILLVDLSKH